MRVGHRWRGAGLLLLLLVCAVLAVIVARGAPAGPPATGTARSRPQVFLDPGHGGVDTGTSGTTLAGQTVDEKTVTLALTLQIAADLRQAGIGVALSRTDDTLPGVGPADYTADGTALTANGVLAELQARINQANASGARVLVSLHCNAFDDPSAGGTQTFYDGARPFAAQSQQLATLIQQTVMAALRAQGYATPDRGVTDDQQLQAESLGTLGNYNHLALLGPAVPGRLQPSQMPGALTEVLYLSNPAEATAAVDPAVQGLLASAFAHAIEQYLAFPS